MLSCNVHQKATPADSGDSPVSRVTRRNAASSVVDVLQVRRRVIRLKLRAARAGEATDKIRPLFLSRVASAHKDPGVHTGPSAVL